MRDLLVNLQGDWSLSTRPWENYYRYIDTNLEGFSDECPELVDGNKGVEIQPFFAEQLFATLLKGHTRKTMMSFNLARCMTGSKGPFAVHYRYLAKASGNLLLKQEEWSHATRRLLFAQSDHWLITRENRLLLADLCISLMQAQRLEDALVICKASDDASQSVFTGVMLGRLLYSSSQYQQALDVLNKASERDKTSSEPYYWLGRVYKEMKQSEQAIEQFEIAKKLSPNSCKIYRELASLYQLQGSDEAFISIASCMSVLECNVRDLLIPTQQPQGICK